MSPIVNAIRRWLHTFVTWQIERPFLIAVLALVTTIPAALAARGLGLRTDFSELLPDNKASVVEMRRVAEKLTSASTLTLVAEVRAPNPDALRRYADAIVPRLRALGPDWVGAIDAGTSESRAYFEHNKLLYAPLEDLREVHDLVRERYDYEVQKRTGAALDDEEPPKLTAESIEQRFGAKAGKADAKASQSGHYLSEDGRTLVVLVHTPVEPGSLEPAKRLKARIDQVESEVDPTQFDPTMQVRHTGDFITSVEEYRAVKDDLAHVGTYGVLMVLGVILLFFLRLRTLVAMGITIAIGLVWSFGVARWLVGYLNSSTGFLVSIIAGNGINFGIIYMARYLEARREQGKSPAESVLIAHQETWLATLAAAGAATVAYGSLAATDFRGFKHFGIIGGTGMILCWIATYLFLPTILVVSEKATPMFLARTAWRTKLRGSYGLGFAWLAERFPRAITVAAALLGVAATVVTVRYFLADPMEYDLTKLRNEHTSQTEAAELSVKVDQIVGRLGQDGMAIMVEKLEQALPVKRELERRKDAAPADAKPFERVVTIYDLLPGDQNDKIPLLNSTRDLLVKSRSRGMISDADWTRLAPYIPPAGLRRLDPTDLPEQLARPFTEKDGTLGRIVYIVPKDGRSIWDGRYLELWADSFRRIDLPGGETIQGSGRAVIFADMLRAVVEDAPKAIVLSLLGTCLIVLLAFRARGGTLPVLLTLMLGVVCMVAFLAIRHMKLNFLNFVALPITFGIGVDYAVNIMQRVRREGTSNMRKIVVETGGAVVLCSLTTTLGYLSLTLSMNQAIVTFGIAAAAGEIACILAAVLVLPAALFWKARRVVVARSG
jgi:uncharacterized protein